MSSSFTQMPELLSPAGSMESVIAAIRCGADAVYVGAKHFSARQAAENFNEETLRLAVDFCHLAQKKLYLAVNTLMLEEELADFDALLLLAAKIGVDACIVQDFGAARYLRSRLPDMPLHASTQMTIHSSDGLEAAAAMGFCRVVLARELPSDTLKTLCAYAHKLALAVEFFVHGAHCMSVSGQCWMSAAMGGRSANRGRCAQPCRLPFTADVRQNDAFALSLRDRCLITHLAALTEMGVDALKIEGRMKRPEYVAAAVSAYADALQGKQPDCKVLQSIFSRSGFTDGYFTGVKKEMFGVRSKEDVLAAKSVLAELQQRYRKPRKLTAINGHYLLTANKPSALTVTDPQSGCCITVTGEIPQKATERPITLPLLHRQFEKLGDTIYTAGTVTADLDGISTLPASALNSLRRDAIARLDAARIAQAAPSYTIKTLPVHSVSNGNVVQKSPTPKLRLEIRRLSQLKAITPDLAETTIDALLLPLWLTDAYSKLEAPPLPPERCILVPPRWITDDSAFHGMLHSAKALGFTHLLCNQLAAIYAGNQIGMTLHGGTGLHITNRLAAEELRQMALCDGLLSPELPHSALHPLSESLPLGVFAYGRLPLMLCRICPIQAQIGCANCKHRLIDRKGAVLYTDCVRYADTPDYAEIFNSAVIWLADRCSEYRHAAYLLLSMTDESPADVKRILLAYRQHNHVTPPARYTRGIRLTHSSAASLSSKEP